VKGNDNSALNDAAALAVGFTHACALRKSQQIVCWGDNSKGQLGASQTPVARNRYLPVPLSGNAESVAAGLQHTCAVVHGGTVYCWGANDWGQLGTGSLTPSSTSTPQLVVDSIGQTLGGAEAVYSGSTARHSCVRTHNGNVYCWGYNYYGELGFGPTQTTGPYPAAQLIDPSLWP
jgi:alpha-tubulin suppressor-like RCC1 family protein